MFTIFTHGIKRIVTIGLFVFLLAIIPAAQSKTITLAADNWEPYVLKEEQEHGIISEVITRAFANVGINVDYHFVPWARALDMAKKGAVEGTFLWYKTPERTPFFYFSDEPLVKFSVVFFHHKDLKFNWESLDDLTEYKIGAPIGSYVSTKFAEYEKNAVLNIQRFPTDLILFKMLMKNRIDIFPQDIIVGYQELNNHFSDITKQYITNHPKPLTQRDAYLLISKSNPKNKKLMAMFNKGFSELKQSGEYSQLFKTAIKNSNKKFDISSQRELYTRVLTENPPVSSPKE